MITAHYLVAAGISNYVRTLSRCYTEYELLDTVLSVEFNHDTDYT